MPLPLHLSAHSVSQFCQQKKHTMFIRESFVAGDVASSVSLQLHKVSLFKVILQKSTIYSCRSMKLKTTTNSCSWIISMNQIRIPSRKANNAYLVQFTNASSLPLTKAARLLTSDSTKQRSLTVVKRCTIVKPVTLLAFLTISSNFIIVPKKHQLLMNQIQMPKRMEPYQANPCKKMSQLKKNQSHKRRILPRTDLQYLLN